MKCLGKYLARSKHHIMKGKEEKREAGGEVGVGWGLEGHADLRPVLLEFSTLHLDHGVQFSLQLFIKDIKNEECIERQWRYLLGRD